MSLLIDDNLNHRLQRYIANSPDLAITVPIESNDIAKVLGAIITGEQLIEAETQILRALTNNYKQMIDMLVQNNLLDQQAVDNFTDGLVTIDHVIAQVDKVRKHNETGQTNDY